ncbi:MAG: HD domain-containing protein [Oscillospiraceae bacterium]
MIQKLTQKMTEYFTGDPKRIQHFIKVHSFARYIGLSEKLPEHEQFLLECAALLHDIGIKPAEAQYGECGGKLQEQLGPPEAEKILAGLDFQPQDVERICYMIAHHHTYTDISGRDLQILIEADFIVNLYEDGESLNAVQTVYRKIFRTESGKALLRTVWALPEERS